MQHGRLKKRKERKALLGKEFRGNMLISMLSWGRKRTEVKGE